MRRREATQSGTGKSLGSWQVLAIALTIVLAGCTGGTATGPGWTFGTMLSAPSPAPGGTAAAGSPTAPPSTATPSSAANATPGPTDSTASEKPFSGRMTPHVLLVDGYVSMYMDLVNTGTEPLTFINTLYDIEPTRLYSPLVAYPWASGGSALVTRDGRFFPSPAIVQPGQRAVYVMGGQRANGTGQLSPPVANIKFCPTRGMDDTPSVPVSVEDLAWSTTDDGVTTVRGTLVETAGSRRSDPPVVGVAFFARDGAFVGAVVNSRVGDRLRPFARVPFELDGRGVDASRIDRAEAYAFVS
jgi:hypothetical protein